MEGVHPFHREESLSRRARTTSVHSPKALPLLSGKHAASSHFSLLLGSAATSQKVKMGVYLFSFDNTSCMSDIDVFLVLCLSLNPDSGGPKV